MITGVFQVVVVLACAGTGWFLGYVFTFACPWDKRWPTYVIGAIATPILVTRGALSTTSQGAGIVVAAATVGVLLGLWSGFEYRDRSRH